MNPQERIAELESKLKERDKQCETLSAQLADCCQYVESLSVAGVQRIAELEAEANELRRKVMHYRAKAEAAGNHASLAVAHRCAEIAEAHTPFLNSGIDGKLIAAAIRREFGLDDAQFAAAREDTALLDWLSKYVEDWGPHHALGIVWDDEDGIWLTRIEHGPHTGIPIEPLNSGGSKTLRQAIAAAAGPDLGQLTSGNVAD